MKNAICILLVGAAAALLPSCIAQTPAKSRPDIRVFFATSTTLAIYSEDATRVVVDEGSMVTLEASVSSSFGAVTQGQVTFCDADAAYCTDIHRLGTAQLRSDGTAIFRFVPGLGQHNYMAVFHGTGSYGGSTSATAPLNVDGQYPTATSISETGAPGDYNVTATVTSVGGTVPMQGLVNFVDTNNSNALLGSVPLANRPGIMNWTNPQTLATSAYPISPVVADFDGDGHLDMGFANVSGHNVVIQLGAGNGTFSIKENLGMNNPTSLAVGDFNGDGVPDIAANNYGLGGGQILIGNGDGTFTESSHTFPTGYAPTSLVVQDFNGDGLADLAVLNICGTDDCATQTSPGTVSILLGNGDGTFTLATSSPTVGVEPMSMAAGDFNGDGITDLAVANSGSDGGNTVTILLGNGDGTFTAVATSPSTGQGFPELAVADFNGDGKADLAVIDAFDYKLTILLGKGDGTFSPAASVATGALPEALVVGDFNGDGIPDIAVANAIDNTDSILVGNGDGTFKLEATLATDMQPAAMAVGDFNEDGVSDLAATTYLGNTIAIFVPVETFTSSASLNVKLDPNSNEIRAEARYESDQMHASSVSGQVTLKSVTTPKITWTTPSPITYGAALSATQLDATANVAGKFAYTPALGTVLAAGAHTLSVTFTPTDTADFQPATITVALTVNKAVLNVFPHNLSSVYGSPLPTLTYVLLGFVNSDTQANATTGAPGLSTTATSKSPAGTYTITSSQGTLAAANYTFKFLTENLTIAKAVLTVFPHNLSKVYGAPLPTLTYVLTGFVNGDTQATATTGAPGLSTTATSKSPVGTYPITSSQGTLAAANYSFKFLTETMTVTRAVLKVAAYNYTRTVGAALPNPFAYSITGFVSGDTAASAVTGAPKITTTAVQGSPAGSYPIVPTAGTLSAKNYSFTFVDGTLTITK